MQTHIVFVKFKQPGVCGSFRTIRYIDSQWALRDHAEARKFELAGSLQMFDVPDWLGNYIDDYRC